jgi:hypothetical protein
VARAPVRRVTVRIHSRVLSDTPVGPRQGRDEGGSEAGHHSHEGSGQHQGRHQEPPAQRNEVIRPDGVRCTALV